MMISDRPVILIFIAIFLMSIIVVLAVSGMLNDPIKYIMGKLMDYKRVKSFQKQPDDAQKPISLLNTESELQGDDDEKLLEEEITPQNPDIPPDISPTHPKTQSKSSNTALNLENIPSTTKSTPPQTDLMDQAWNYWGGKALDISKKSMQKFQQKREKIQEQKQRRKQEKEILAQQTPIKPLDEVLHMIVFETHTTSYSFGQICDDYNTNKTLTDNFRNIMLDKLGVFGQQGIDLVTSLLIEFIQQYIKFLSIENAEIDSTYLSDIAKRMLHDDCNKKNVQNISCKNSVLLNQYEPQYNNIDNLIETFFLPLIQQYGGRYSERGGVDV